MAVPNSSISSFRRFLARILLPLILVISAAGLIVNYFFEKMIFSSEQCGAYKVHRIITETHPNEIPIFGSSRAEGGYIPDSLGHEMFNYGLSGTRYDVTLFFLNEECKKKKATPWIILNLDLDGIGDQLGDIANYIPDAGYPAVRELLGKEYHAYYRVPFLKYYGRFENYTRSYLNDRIQLTKLSDKGASLEKNVLTTEAFNRLVTERRNTKTFFECDTLLRARLLHYITACPNRRFVFVIAPYHHSYFDQYQDWNDAEAFLERLRAHSNVNVFDFRRLPLPDDDFLNTSHVNYKGAIVFNRVLRDSLGTLGIH